MNSDQYRIPSFLGNPPDDLIILYGEQPSDSKHAAIKNWEKKREVEITADLVTERIESLINEDPAISSNTKAPTYIEVGQFGYLDRQNGERTKFGKVSSRPCRLLRTLMNPLGTFKTTDIVFEAIGLPKDTSDPQLRSRSIERKIELIDYAIKELQRNGKLRKNDLYIRWGDKKKTLKIDYSP